MKLVTITVEFKLVMNDAQYEEGIKEAKATNKTVLQIATEHAAKLFEDKPVGVVVTSFDAKDV